MSKYKNRGSLPVNFEGFINARMPQDVFTFFDDFMGPTASIEPDTDMITDGTSPCGPWTYTAVAGGATVALVDATNAYYSTLGGILRITTVASIDDGGNFQVAGTQFTFDKDCGLPLYLEARFRTSDISNTDMFVGLSHVDTEICSTGVNDGVGFKMVAGVLYAHSAKNSLERSVDTGITEADGAAGSNAGWIRVALYFDGKDKVSFWVDGNDDGEFDFVTTLTVETTLDYISDDEPMTPTIEVIAGTTHSAGVFDIDYILVQQQRFHA